jgi:hypothetical protein
MAPKPKPVAKGKAPPTKEPPAKEQPQSAPEEKPAPSVADVEAHLLQLPEEDWAELAAVEAPAEPVARALEGILLLLGHTAAEASSWPTARSAVQDAPFLLRQLQALGPWGAAEGQLEAASAALQVANVRQLERPGTAEAPTASAGSRAGAAAAKAKAPAAKAKAPAKAATAKPKAASTAPPDPGASAALALGMMAEALIAMRRTEKPPPFPMVWPLVPFSKLHSMLQQTMLSRQTACVLCEDAAAYSAAVLYCKRSDAVLVDIRHLQVRVGLAKNLSMDGLRLEVGASLREALKIGRRYALLLGDSLTNLRHVCDAKQVPIEMFDGERQDDTAKALELSGASPGFHVSILVQASKEQSSMLGRVLPSFDDMAVLILDSSSLPSAETLSEEAEPSLKAALQLLASKLPSVQAAPAASANAEVPNVGATASDISKVWNTMNFEYLEMFGDDWEDRWTSGPATTDESGKPIRPGLINYKIINYPTNPKDAKRCLQIMGGAANAPCTGIWTSFTPICRPTEIEFEFTINGKVDLPNACLVFTEKAFEGALPDAKVGVQFMVRGGMQLAGGPGNLVRISNDGKIKNDRWNKVILRIDWKEKIIVGQVDTQGRGYAPAIQTVPFRDPDCQGFGFAYIYNTDVQGTSWFHSLRVKQAEMKAIDTEALDARAYFAQKEKQREYDKAVAADMEVGMKMGAIKSTAQHGMNLAQEQACNGASAAGAAMGR